MLNEVSGTMIDLLAYEQNMIEDLEDEFQAPFQYHIMIGE